MLGAASGLPLPTSYQISGRPISVRASPSKVANSPALGRMNDRGAGQTFVDWSGQSTTASWSGSRHVSQVLSPTGPFGL